VTWCTGGTITFVGGRRIHTFLGNGTLTVVNAGQLEYLVVAGGGGGGNSDADEPSAGGGGAGGLRAASGFAVAMGDIAITVGAGGGSQANGGNSIFSTITCLGGGAGGHHDSGAAAGGSGGGGGANNGPYGAGNAGEGYHGGNADQVGGPGGGAGGVGTDAVGFVLGSVGPGVASSISGASVTYATGGQGGAHNDGAANRGDGGGGAPPNDTSGGSGGSGIVIVSYEPTQPQARILHYLLDVNDPRQLIRDQFDREVPPEELRPNKWLAIVGWRPPSAEIIEDYINDPEKVPINSVRFTEPDDYSLGSGTDDLLDSVLARLTQRSA
jgi:hypothetical protein